MANLNYGNDTAVGVAEDVFLRPSECRRDQSCGATHAEERSDVSRNRVRKKSGHCEADYGDNALQKSIRASHTGFVGSPRGELVNYHCKCGRGSSEAECLNLEEAQAIH